MTEPLTADEEKRLVEAMRAGDMRARDRLVASVDWVVRALATKHAGIVSADDLAQEGRIAVMGALVSFDPSRAHLSRFAWRRVRGAIMDAIAVESARREDVASGDGTIAAGHDERLSADEMVYEIRQQATDAEWRAMELRAMGMSWGEVGEFMGTNATAARLSARRGMAKARRVKSEWEE